MVIFGKIIEIYDFGKTYLPYSECFLRKSEQTRGTFLIKCLMTIFIYQVS